ncbi:glycosyltransferase family 2 protein [Pedobacter xixiisoli]|uniref:Glycosyltransferase involved in cell wall bisynthesis n=1 Tax=Pedobacter xixiisoli TaxID=1476464 RepID=A0A286A9Q8_9SPHI|nr:glycosyltransferase family 2 protein [Pedobacter xixiisoli]SOD18622.1 Glycosyltransferase involved in cell wall bisynthesis [Pedobacter xixiisoli]
MPDSTLNVDVSIIITHYKQYSYLTNLLNYISNNDDLSASEIIIIDDKSLANDDLTKLVKSHPRYKFYQNEVNRGPSFSRNFGANISTAKYIQFLDADDWITPEKIKVQYQKAVALNFPSFVCSDWARVTFDSDYQNLEVIQAYQPNLEEPTLINILIHFFPLMSGLILKQDFIDINGFNEEMRLIEDVNLAIRLFSLKERFYYFKSDPLFFYRVNNPNSLSNSNELEFWKSNLDNYKLCFDLAEKKYSLEKIQEYRSISFRVIWLTFLKSCEIKNIIFINETIKELHKTERPINLTLKHGKTFLLTKLIGLKLASKLLSI